MFERFSDPARRVVVLAHEEARMLDHNYIGTEHVLLGLIHEHDAIAARALESLGVGLQPARQQVEEIIGRGKYAAAGHIPFTPRSKKVLELSLREALQFGDDFIAPEHILLGLLREGDGVAVQMLVRLGVDLNLVRQTVIELAHSTGRWPATSESAEGTGPRVARRPAPSELLEGIGLSAVRPVRRELWLTTMQNQLAQIAERLDAIERHLGIEPTAKPRGGSAEAEAPGSAEAEAAGSAEADAPGSAEAEAPGSAEAEGAGSAEAEAPGSAEAEAAGSAEADAPGSAEAEAPGSGEAKPGASGGADAEPEPPAARRQRRGSSGGG
jgi:hypothetical protein